MKLFFESFEILLINIGILNKLKNLIVIIQKDYINYNKISEDINL